MQTKTVVDPNSGKSKNVTVFSRRHDNNTEPHDTAMAIWQERQDEKSRGVTCRTSRRAKRTASDQLGVLDARLGEGMGATRERARLQALIDAA